MIRWHLVRVAIITLTLVACGARVGVDVDHPVDPGATPPRSDWSTPPETVERAVGEDGAVDTGVRPIDADAPNDPNESINRRVAPTPGSTSPGRAYDTSFPFSVAIAPPCVAPGGVTTVNLATRAYAAVSAAIAYSDGEAHGALTVGDASSDGSWRWSLSVSPDAPLGTAEVLVSAQDRAPSPDGESTSTTGEHANDRVPLEVSRTC